MRKIVISLGILTGLGALLVLLRPKKEITFSEHIAPIVFKNCAPCHHPGGAGPFPLLTYKDISKRGKLIKHVTLHKIMPPWPADPSYSRFAGEKLLSEEEIELIAQWVDQGKHLGDTGKLPSPPVFPKGSRLGKPDLVVKMQKPYFIKGDNKDNFLMMKLPFELPSDTFIKAIEFIPGNKKRVHHVNGHLLQYNDEDKKDVFEGEYFVDLESYDVPEGYKILKVQNDNGSYPLLSTSVTNYLPGVITTLYPEGIGGWKVKKKGAILFKDIHYGPTAKDEYDNSYVNFFFSKEPPKRRTLEIQLGTHGISEIIPPLIIPPNTVKTFHTEGVILGDISLLTINPHMHLLGKKFLAYAIKPGGDTIPLIRINNWDFRWQYFYTFKKPVKLPKGTRVYVEGTYDNTVKNPRNPFHPPREVRDHNGSMRTTDEMFQFIMTYVPYQEGDENINLENYSLEKK